MCFIYCNCYPILSIESYFLKNKNTKNQFCCSLRYYYFYFILIDILSYIDKKKISIRLDYKLLKLSMAADTHFDFRSFTFFSICNCKNVSFIFFSVAAIRYYLTCFFFSVNQYKNFYSYTCL